MVNVTSIPITFVIDCPWSHEVMSRDNLRPSSRLEGCLLTNRLLTLQNGLRTAINLCAPNASYSGSEGSLITSIYFKSLEECQYEGVNVFCTYV